MAALRTLHHSDCTAEEEEELLHEIHGVGLVIQALRQRVHNKTTEKNEVYGNMRSAYNKSTSCEFRRVSDMLYYEVNDQIRRVSDQARKFCNVTITFRELSPNQAYLRYNVSVPVGMEKDAAGYHLPKGEQTHLFFIYSKGTKMFENGVKVPIN